MPTPAANRVVRAIAVLVTTAVVITMTPAAAAATASGRVEYRPPSDAAIIDHFRPPASPWGAGNRGVDLGTSNGDPVRAAAAGRVLFAGEVGGALHITVEHSDGLRTSYSFLATVSVVRGDSVQRGEVIGTAAGPFHFGVRTPTDTYLDPELLLAGRLRPDIVLVPGAEEGLEPLEAHERSTLLETLRDTGAAALAHLARVTVDGVDLARQATEAAVSLSGPARTARVVAALARWYQQRGSCTPVSAAVPGLDQRHVVIEVSGLGTSSRSNSAWEFDTTTIGYAPADVIRFSYRGGRVPGQDGDGSTVAATSIAGPVTTFSGEDSQQPISVSADRLGVLIADVARAQPGVPIDLLAHSQGGVVARLAIERAAAAGRLPDTVRTLVTVGSPHAGAPLATGVGAMQLSPAGRMVLAELRSSGVAGPLDDRLPAMTDLAATSPVMAELHDRPMPKRVRFVSLGGSGDLIVPGVATGDTGDTGDSGPLDQRILPTPISTGAHGALTSDPRTTREIALAVTGSPLTCQSMHEAMGAFLEAEAVSTVETVTTLSAATAGVVAGGALPTR